MTITIERGEVSRQTWDIPQAFTPGATPTYYCIIADHTHGIIANATGDTPRKARRRVLARWLGVFAVRWLVKGGGA